MKKEQFEMTELYHAYVKNTWYAITVSFGAIAYSHNRKDKYSHILFLVSCAFTVSALMLILKIRDLINDYPEFFDMKLRTIYYIFMVSICVLLYISLDSIRTGYLKH